MAIVFSTSSQTDKRTRGCLSEPMKMKKDPVHKKIMHGKGKKVS